MISTTSKQGSYKFGSLMRLSTTLRRINNGRKIQVEVLLSFKKLLIRSKTSCLNLYLSSTTSVTNVMNYIKTSEL